MKQLVILSGKGGTGKTTVTAALTHLAAQNHRVVLADADVDAANLGLVLSPVTQETHDFAGGRVAVVDAARCIACGRCAEVCRFDAVQVRARLGDAYTVDPLACEGCAACLYECPADAIEMQPQPAGQWFVATTRYGPLYHAHLFAGQENSGKLVTLVKQMARLRAFDDEADLLLVDGPPGIGCPVIAALSGADLALIVTEPTVSGAHDLERVLELAVHFNIPATVLLNKADLSLVQAEVIATYCAANNIPLVGRLPYDPAVTDALVRGMPVTMGDGLVSSALHEVWRRLQNILVGDSPEAGRTRG
jgi:MinD superfamily P-loop ATPase